MNRRVVLAACALVATAAVLAQEPGPIDFSRPDSVRMPGFTLPDSLAHLSPWREEYRPAVQWREERPAVSMTSIVVVPEGLFSEQISILDNNTLRLMRRLTISNGQAWNWGPYPDSFLDARTLSFPMPR